STVENVGRCCYIEIYVVFFFFFFFQAEDGIRDRTVTGVQTCALPISYIEYLKETGLSDYAHTPGNRGVWLLCQDQGAEVEFTTLTLWDSIESIKAFAGEDYERARYYPRDREFLTRFDPKVEHFEVVEVAPR